MSINIVVSDTVGINVKGFINNEDGIAKPFDFFLVCKRMTTDEIELSQKSDGTIADLFAGIVSDWKRVKSQSGDPVSYSEESLRSLFKIPGVAQLTYRTYLSEVGAKEKN
jgi:hypothetical protein